MGVVLVGTLRPSFAGVRSLASTSFQYEPSYLDRAGAFAISPDLPLHSARSWAPDSHVLFGAFDDASPDEWGTKLVDANHADRYRTDPTLVRRLGPWEHLLGVSDFSRMGALRFRSRNDETWLSSDGGVANLHDLEKIVSIAAKYDADEATDAEVAYLSGVATSPGGTRPKANVVTESGRLAIAKLPHSKDSDMDTERWEALALTLAARCEIPTAAWFLRPGSAEKSVLVLERFDRDGSSRIPYISAATALGIGAHDLGRYTYEQFTDPLSELSIDPRRDLRDMFNRIALTVLINNVDDHWRNHGFLRSSRGWRLSPVFDINPSTSVGVVSSRPISDQDDPRDRDITNLLAVSDAFRLSRAEGRERIRRIARVVAQWPTVAADLGIPQSQQRRMARAFDSEKLTAAQSI
ncbi:type II toxin-antitoxin system HipA family toxin [Microbacteriaceae bacterium VKM Ac-2854]|nr:type II toxin-antitoxin system HipA family toxin [Microbacteriaceae bacterium VKM Ac-2854]